MTFKMKLTLPNDHFCPFNLNLLNMSKASQTALQNQPRSKATKMTF